MEHPSVTTSLCHLCRLLQFDDFAAGCREDVDGEGRARLSFEGAEVEWRTHELGGRNIYKLIRLRWHLGDSLPHLPRLSTFSRAGCDFCNTLHLGLMSRLDPGYLSLDSSLFDGDVSLTAYVSLSEEGVDGLVVELVSKEIGRKERSVRVFFPIEASPGCERWLGAEPARHGGYLTSENTSEMCRVLRECTGNCHSWEASYLPTRLVDVGTSISDIPRLVLTSDILITAETKYAALSYCWGDAEDAKAQLKTETETLNKRFQGISLETMTTAMRDAVELTRAIGLRYIWIDSLCIIQDDTADWSCESGQMDRVFHNAFVTFCALVSPSCHQSFLQRVPAVTVPFHSIIRPDINGYISVRLRPLFVDTTPHGTYTLDRNMSKWNSRAWTYQEEMMSTRLLYFGAMKMHFRCGTHQWSEGDDQLSRLEVSTISLHDRIAGIKRGEYPASSLYDAWNMLVHDYAPRQITHETDRLPAMSGLARLVWEILGDQYLAGLWKGNILTGLAWSSSPTTCGLQNHLQSIREGEYIAPSWSWAACYDGGVSSGYLGWQTVPECTLLDTYVKTDLQNPFGRVYDGYLRIRSKVAPVPSLLRKGSWSVDNPSVWWLKLNGKYEHSVAAYLDWRSQHNEEGLENLVMLLLHSRHLPDPPYDSNRDRVCGALILYPTGTPDEYHRVGRVHSSGEAAYNIMKTWFEFERDEKICTII